METNLTYRFKDFRLNTDKHSARPIDSITHEFTFTADKDNLITLKQRLTDAVEIWFDNKLPFKGGALDRLNRKEYVNLLVDKILKME